MIPPQEIPWLVLEMMRPHVTIEALVTEPIELKNWIHQLMMKLINLDTDSRSVVSGEEENELQELLDLLDSFLQSGGNYTDQNGGGSENFSKKINKYLRRCK